jgi:ABC-type uncharacterized transport system auxiliary subunit
MSKAFLLLPCLLILSACMPSLDSTEPPERSYWLDAVDLGSDEVRDGLRVNVAVSVVPGLESDRIWILEGDQRLNYYAGAFWADSLEPLLESVLERSLNGSGPITDEVLVRVQIERFFALEGAGEAAPVVELHARLEGRADGRITCEFANSSRAGSNRLRDIVAAHQSLVDELAGAVARFAGELADGGEISC